MVKRAFKLTIDGKTYQVSVLHSGAISIDDNIFAVEMEEKGVRINGEPLTASLSEGFAIVGGKLYETEWEVE